jgi:hypothetical protein
MNTLVKIITTDDGNETNDNNWHLVDPGNPLGEATLCGEEFFGGGESACEFELKESKRGGVTCPKCLTRLRIYKSVCL